MKFSNLSSNSSPSFILQRKHTPNLNPNQKMKFLTLTALAAAVVAVSATPAGHMK